jgi:hypothetical protein
MDRSQELESILQGLQLDLVKQVDQSKSTQRSESSRVDQTATVRPDVHVHADRKPDLPSNNQPPAPAAASATSSTVKGMCGACNMPVVGQVCMFSIYKF